MTSQQDASVSVHDLIAAFDESDEDEQLMEQSVVEEQKLHQTPNTNEDSTSSTKSNQIASLFQTASNKKVNIRKSNLMKAESMLEREMKANFPQNESPAETSNPNEIPSLFQTASNKKVNIKKDHLKRVEDSMSDEFQQDTTNVTNGNSFTSPQPSTTTSLFQTASNKKVTVEKKTLLQAECAFSLNDNLESSDIAERKSPASGTIASLFQTASNKKVNIGKNALQRAETAFAEPEETMAENKSPAKTSTTPSLFQTASNKKVNVRKSNLMKAESIFAGDESIATISDSSSGEISSNLFQTSSSKKAEIKHSHLKSTAVNVENSVTPTRQEGLSSTPSPAPKVPHSIEKSTPTRKRKRPSSILDSSARKKSKFVQYQKDSPNAQSPTITPRNSISKTPKSSAKKGKPFKSPRLNNSSMTVHVAGKQNLPLVSPQPKASIVNSSVAPLVGPSWIPVKKPGKDRVYIADFVARNRQTLTEESPRPTLPEEITFMTSESATGFLFELEQCGSNFISLLQDSLGASEPLPLYINHKHFQKILLHLGAKKDVISQKWVQNHFRWIVWKCGCTQRRFPSLCKDYLSPITVLSQLIGRYNCEYTRGQKSILKKVFESDAPDSIHMVLTVASTSMLTDVSTVTMPNPNTSVPLAVIEVTDGWYSCNMGLDESLSRYVNWGRIKEGCKLRVCNGQLVGLDSSCSPLDAPELSFINYTINSVRRAKWDRPMGVQSPSMGFKVNVASLDPRGGAIPQVEGIVQKRYPLMFMERLELPNNQVKRITRSATAEEQAAMSHQQTIQTFIEKHQDQLINKMNLENQEQLEEELNFIRPDQVCDADILLTMAQLGEHTLTDDQNRIVQKQAQRIQFQRSEAVKKDIQGMMAMHGLSMERKIIPFFTVLMKDSCPYTRKREKSPTFERDGGRLFKLTIWIASEEIYERFSEGKHLRISAMDISQSGSANMLTLKSTPQTFTEELPCSDADKKLVGYVERQCSLIADLEASVSHRQEFDTVGYILHVGEKTRVQRALQIKIYVADVRSSLILLIKLQETESRECGWTPRIGQSYAFENLVYTLFDRKYGMHVCIAGLDSVCTEIPRLKHLSTALNAFVSLIETQGRHLRNMQTKIESILESDPSHINSKKFLQTTLGTVSSEKDEEMVNTDSGGEVIVGNLVIDEQQVAIVHIDWDFPQSQEKPTNEMVTTSRFSFPIPCNMFDRPEELICLTRHDPIPTNPLTTPLIHNSSSSEVEKDNQDQNDADPPSGTEAAPILVEETPEKDHPVEIDASLPISFHLDVRFNQGDTSKSITLNAEILCKLIQDVHRKRPEDKGECEWLTDFIQHGTVFPEQDDTLTSLISAHRQHLWTSMTHVSDIFFSMLTGVFILDRSTLESDAANALTTVEDFRAYVLSKVELTEYQQSVCKKQIFFFEDEWEAIVCKLCLLLEEPMLKVVFHKEHTDEIVSMEVTTFDSIQDLFDMTDDG